MMVPSVSKNNQQWHLHSSRKMMLSFLILHMFIIISPCDGTKKRRIRVLLGESSNGRRTSSEDLNHFVLEQSRVVENLIDDDLIDDGLIDDLMMDDDRWDRDPSNNDADNPETLTWYPSITPVTESPTPVPTLAPVTSLPTAVPTSITKSPSGSSPTAAPTRSPTLSSTKAPSRSPFPTTSSPSKAPISKSPSRSPTKYRSPTTMVPSSILSESPTCVYDTSSGTVGNAVDYKGTELRYFYEIETKSDPPASMDVDILPALELKILSALAPDFIPSGCVTSVRRGRDLAKEDPRVYNGSTMAGISVKPVDVVLPTKTRSGCLPSTGSCTTAILGIMTIYVTGVADGWTKDLMNAIEEGMKDDVFVDAHASITKVIFIGEDVGNPFPPSPSPTGAGTGTTPTADQRTRIGEGMMVLYVMLGVGSLVSLVALGKVARTRRRVSDGIEYEESLSSGVSIGSIKDLGDFEHSNPHDLDTVRVSNRALEDDMEVNVDLESFDSKENDDGCFDFFDLILEGSSPNGTQVRTRGTTPKEGRHDDMSEISF